MPAKGRYERGPRHYVVSIDVECTGGRWFATVIRPQGVQGVALADREEAVRAAKASALDALAESLRDGSLNFDAVVFATRDR
jgi:hypothetical protein